MPITCPDQERLRQLLDDALPAADEQALQEHLETCPQCRRVLESLAAGGVTWDQAARNLAGESSDEHTEPALREVVAQLRGGPPSTGGDETQAEAKFRVSDELPFLDAPRHEGDLGHLDHYRI